MVQWSLVVLGSELWLTVSHVTKTNKQTNNQLYRVLGGQATMSGRGLKDFSAYGIFNLPWVHREATPV